MTPAPINEVVLQELGFLLEQFRLTNPPVTAALACSSDGLLLAASNGIDRDRADTLSASLSMLVGLGKGVATHLDDHLDLAALQMGTGWLLTYQPTDRVVLTALAPLSADLGAVKYGLDQLGTKVGHLLDPGPRTAMTPAVPVTAGHR